MKDAEGKTTSSPHAAAARRAMQVRLRDLGHPRMDLDTAIRRGILTELDWCEELDRQREAYGAQGGGSRLTAEQAEAALQRGRQKSRDYYHRRKALRAAQ